MSRERWFNVKIECVEENDGPMCLRKGVERSIEVLSVDEAVKKYDARGIRRALYLAWSKLKEQTQPACEICQDSGWRCSDELVMGMQSVPCICAKGQEEAKRLGER